MNLKRRFMMQKIEKMQKGMKISKEAKKDDLL